MGTLHLVRHGQASFGADDYDRLSPLGHRQARRLGEWFGARGTPLRHALVGTMRRHRETLAGIVDGLGTPLEATEWPGLNEYDSAAVIAAVHPAPLPVPRTAEDVRQHFRLLRQGLSAWMRGEVQPAGMPSHADFLAGIVAALDHVRSRLDGEVLLVSSGGPISTAVGHVLGAGPDATIELNMRIRNCALTEFSFNPKRHVLVSFNALPHFEHADCAGWTTYT